MHSKWLSKPKCDHRWPASVRLSATYGRSTLAPRLSTIVAAQLCWKTRKLPIGRGPRTHPSHYAR